MKPQRTQIRCGFLLAVAIPEYMEATSAPIVTTEVVDLEAKALQKKVLRLQRRIATLTTLLT